MDVETAGLGGTTCRGGGIGGQELSDEGKVDVELSLKSFAC